MQIPINVVDYENQLWFELEGVMFDTLEASWHMDRKEVFVVRYGLLIARARVHEARGEPVFTDHDPESPVRLNGGSLHAEDFKPNDQLLLEVPDGFDLLADLRRSCWVLESMIASVPVGQPMSMDELANRMSPELERTASTAQTAQVLRFRRGK